MNPGSLDQKSNTLQLSHAGHMNPFPNKPLFLCFKYKPFENTVGKGEISRYKQMTSREYASENLHRFCRKNKMVDSNVLVQDTSEFYNA